MRDVWDREKRLTRFLTGRRFFYMERIAYPVNDHIQFGLFTGRVYHPEQAVNFWHSNGLLTAWGFYCMLKHMCFSIQCCMYIRSSPSPYSTSNQPATRRTWYASALRSCLWGRYNPSGSGSPPYTSSSQSINRPLIIRSVLWLIAKRTQNDSLGIWHWSDSPRSTRACTRGTPRVQFANIRKMVLCQGLPHCLRLCVDPCMARHAQSLNSSLHAWPQNLEAF